LSIIFMRTLLFLVSLAAAIALPVFALELGPAGVPGAPGLEPPPVPVQPVDPPSPKPALPLPPAPPPQKAKPQVPPPKISAACAKAKNVKLCMARQEQKRKARVACKDETGEARQQCVNDYLNRGKK
jgi:outer membrane biosynthesis protein TonB